jgi:hypothetical protein
MAAYLLTQNREILAESTPVHVARDSFMHPIICYTRCQAPLYSERATKSCCCSGGCVSRISVAASLCEASRVAHRATATVEVVVAFAAGERLPHLLGAPRAEHRYTAAALLIVDDRLCWCLLQFKLRAYPLYLRRLLSHSCGERPNFLLLLRSN